MQQKIDSAKKFKVQNCIFGICPYNGVLFFAIGVFGAFPAKKSPKKRKKFKKDEKTGQKHLHFL